MLTPLVPRVTESEMEGDVVVNMADRHSRWRVMIGGVFSIGCMMLYLTALMWFLGHRHHTGFTTEVRSHLAFLLTMMIAVVPVYLTPMYVRRYERWERKGRSALLDDAAAEDRNGGTPS